MKANVRTSWQVTRSVWSALFIREALARTTADRFAWFWMLAEPIALIVIMVGIRAVGNKLLNNIAGADYIGWSMLGLMGFFLYRECLNRSLGAIDSNKGLFNYRQVLPVDTVIVRCALEGLIKTIIFLIFIFLGAWLRFDFLPDDSMESIYVWCTLWMIGLASGMVFSVLNTLYTDIGRIVKICMLPLLILSGTLMPINYLPVDIQELLLINPLVHGLELLRQSFYSEYRMINGISFMYLNLWAIGLMALGLWLNIFFLKRLKTL